MPNNLDVLADKIMAAGLVAMRGTHALSRQVNRSYDVEAAEIGSTIDIPIPSAVPAEDVVPSHTPSAPASVTPTKAQIIFDFWKRAPFHLTDKEARAVEEGRFVPMQTSEAVKSIITAWNTYLANKMRLAFFNANGTAGTTPFASDLAVYNDARRLLNVELAPTRDRRVILDPNAESNALARPQFNQADQRGDQGGIVEGEIGRKLGADWFMDQGLVSHTAGVQGGSPTATGSLGASTVAITGGGASGTYLAGDIVSFAGHNQTYVVTANLTLSAGAGTLAIFPPLRAAVSAAAVTQRATHMNNFVFHRDAVAAAIRTLPPPSSQFGVISRTAIDPVTGIPLRLIIKLQHYQVEYAFDLLGGATVPRPEWGVRLLG
jgi:hypothetical protein